MGDKDRIKGICSKLTNNPKDQLAYERILIFYGLYGAMQEPKTKEVVIIPRKSRKEKSNNNNENKEKNSNDNNNDKPKTRTELINEKHYPTDNVIALYYMTFNKLITQREFTRRTFDIMQLQQNKNTSKKKRKACQNNHMYCVAFHKEIEDFLDSALLVWKYPISELESLAILPNFYYAQKDFDSSKYSDLDISMRDLNGAKQKKRKRKRKRESEKPKQKHDDSHA